MTSAPRAPPADRERSAPSDRHRAFGIRGDHPGLRQHARSRAARRAARGGPRDGEQVCARCGPFDLRRRSWPVWAEERDRQFARRGAGVPRGRSRPAAGPGAGADARVSAPPRDDRWDDAAAARLSSARRDRLVRGRLQPGLRRARSRRRADVGPMLERLAGPISRWRSFELAACPDDRPIRRGCRLGPLVDGGGRFAACRHDQAAPGDLPVAPSGPRAAPGRDPARRRRLGGRRRRAPRRRAGGRPTSTAPAVVAAPGERS